MRLLVDEREQPIVAVLPAAQLDPPVHLSALQRPRRRLVQAPLPGLMTWRCALPLRLAGMIGALRCTTQGCRVPVTLDWEYLATGFLCSMTNTVSVHCAL